MSAYRSSKLFTKASFNHLRLRDGSPFPLGAKHRAMKQS